MLLRRKGVPLLFHFLTSITYICIAKSNVTMKSQNTIICIKKKKTDTDGYLFLRRKGKENRVKLSLKIKVNFEQFKKYWNDKDECFKSGMPNYKLFNAEIVAALKELEKTNNVIIPKSKDKNSFLKYWEIKISDMENHNTKTKNENVKIKLTKYLSTIDKQDIYFNQLTPEFIKEVQKYFKTANDPKKLSPNTATHYLKMVKMVIDSKLEDEPHLYVVHPFTGVKYDKKTEIERVVLTEVEIERLLNTEIEDKQIDANRDKILFQIFASGMRVSDLLLLRWSNVITGLPIVAGTQLPPIPIGQKLQPVLKYRMFKTNALVETEITFNLCMIFMKLIGLEWRAYQLLEDTVYNGLFLPKIFNENNLTLSELQAEIRKHCIQGPSKPDKDMIEYKGYVMKNENKELKEAIDFVEMKKEEQANSLIEDTMYRVTKYIWDNKCLNDFVFPHLNSELFKHIKTDNGWKGQLTKELNQKLLNGETLYNRQLKQVAEKCGIVSNLYSHAGRHTFAQLMLNEGAPTHEIMDKLRHTNLSTTDKYLRHKNFRNGSTDYISQIGNKQKYRKN